MMAGYPIDDHGHHLRVYARQYHLLIDHDVHLHLFGY